jgi:hypothetical protein
MKTLLVMMGFFCTCDTQINHIRSVMVPPGPMAVLKSVPAEYVQSYFNGSVLEFHDSERRIRAEGSISVTVRVNVGKVDEAELILATDGFSRRGIVRNS